MTITHKGHGDELWRKEDADQTFPTPLLFYPLLGDLLLINTLNVGDLLSIDSLQPVSLFFKAGGG